MKLQSSAGTESRLSTVSESSQSGRGIRIASKVREGGVRQDWKDENVGLRRHGRSGCGVGVAQNGGCLVQATTPTWLPASRKTRVSLGRPAAISTVRAVERNSGQCEATPKRWPFGTGNQGLSQPCAERICSVMSSIPYGRIARMLLVLLGRQSGMAPARFSGFAASSREMPFTGKVVACLISVRRILLSSGSGSMRSRWSGGGAASHCATR
jgi:hypothetical protein